MNVKAHYATMEGLGNKILVVDFGAELNSLTTSIFEQICQKVKWDFDQLMAIFKPIASLQDVFDYQMEIYNRDGSEAEACANGTRCVTAYLYHNQKLERERLYKIFTKGGDLKISFLEEGMTSLWMPSPIFDDASIGLRQPLSREDRLFFLAKREVPLGGVSRAVEFVSMGNPHAVFFVANDWRMEKMQDWLKTFGSKLENDPLFKNRCNINLVQLKSTNSLKVVTWERGAGLTKACGTGACASVAVATLLWPMEQSIEVTLPGGVLNICWSGKVADPLIMRGPAKFIGNKTNEIIIEA